MRKTIANLLHRIALTIEPSPSFVGSDGLSYSGYKCKCDDRWIVTNGVHCIRHSSWRSGDGGQP